MTETNVPQGDHELQLGGGDNRRRHSVTCIPLGKFEACARLVPVLSTPASAKDFHANIFSGEHFILHLHCGDIDLAPGAGVGADTRRNFAANNRQLHQYAGPDNARFDAGGFRAFYERL